MERLPMEILELILSDSALSIRDVINFSSTCHYYRGAVMFNKRLWRKKFKDGWPLVWEELGTKSTNYLKELVHVHILVRRIERKLRRMPTQFCRKYEISDCELYEWSVITEKNHRNYIYLVDYLMKIVNCTDKINSVDVVRLKTPGNKTHQYYAGKVLRFVRQTYLSEKWIDFKSLPRREQLLEDGAIFVAQWCQPHLDISAKIISAKLDKIANSVKKKLKIQYPKHKIFSVPQEVLDNWKKYNLDAHQWSPVECRQIMGVLREVLFEDMRFKGNNTAYYMPQNSYINEVLNYKQGLPITLSIVYEAVARRLGLFFQPINFPSHFLLRFQEKNQDWYYIDVYNGGNITRRPPGDFDLNKLVASATDVVQRMASNLEVSARQHTQVNGRVTRLRSSLELLKLVSPHDMASLVSLARLYMLHSMDTRSLEAFLLSEGFEAPEQAQRVLHMLQNYQMHPPRPRTASGQPIPVKRPPNLKFAVGMIMTHLALDYKCVIYDWDPTCHASIEWQEQMHVDLLRLGNKQPFYNVLVEDGSHRYVAQENLQPSHDTGYLHLNEDIGRYFSHYYKTHYVPNRNKAKEYPYDKEVRLSYHNSFMEMQMETHDD